MSLIVKKFGGTSVATIKHIQEVAKKVIDAKQSGDHVVVVLSAMGDDTDRLAELTKAVTTQPKLREYDFLLSSGEQRSVGLLSIMLNAMGCEARAYAGWQIGIRTDDVHERARIESVDEAILLRDIKQGIVPVITGFQGVNPANDITTLGRGGSDTTAVALAAALGADECQIYTDVEGVYTTDPRIVLNARLIKHITFEEILEMASLGAKVLQSRAVELAGKYKVPLRVLSSFKPGQGTLITFEESGVEKPLVTGIAFNRQEARITLSAVKDKAGAVATILKFISNANIVVDVIVQGGSVDGKFNLSFTIHRNDYQQSLALLEKVKGECGIGGISGDKAVAKVSLVGVGMRSHSGVATKMFEVLGQEGINIDLITTSEIKTSVVIDEKYLELAVRALHAAFNLEKESSREEFDPYVPA